jgi:hypothetical protein
MNEQGVRLNREQLVQPGDKYKIIDTEGEEFYVTGSDDPLLIELVRAVDGLLVSRGIDQQAYDRAWGILKARFDDLPMRVRGKLSGFVVLEREGVEL